MDFENTYERCLFRDMRVPVGGRVFRHCRFERCLFIADGQPFWLEDCSIVEARLELGANAAAFLNGLQPLINGPRAAATVLKLLGLTPPEQ
jgi:hypothetical protein